MPIGTHTVADLQSITTISAFNYGLQAIADVLQRDLAAYNAVVQDAISELATSTTEREGIYGASADGEMFEADEFDRGVSVKISSGSNVATPLDKFMRDIGWTADYMLQNTPQQIANAQIAVQGAHRRALQRMLRRAIFSATNITVRDRFVSPQVNLAVKRFVNADGASIPNGPNGEVFNANTHTHYDFFNGVTPSDAAITALIADVAEHGHTRSLRLNINLALESAMRALPGFVAYQDERLVLATNVNQAAIRLDQTRVDNRAIGLFGLAEVWTRSWVPPGYVFVADFGASEKPLRFREHPVVELRGLRIAATVPDYPLYANVMDAYFGFGVFNRTNGAALYYAPSASAYVEPTF